MHKESQIALLVSCVISLRVWRDRKCQLTCTAGRCKSIQKYYYKSHWSRSTLLKVEIFFSEFIAVFGQIHKFRVHIIKESHHHYCSVHIYDLNWVKKKTEGICWWPAWKVHATGWTFPPASWRKLHSSNITEGRIHINIWISSKLLSKCALAALMRMNESLSSFDTVCMYQEDGVGTRTRWEVPFNFL